MISHCNVSASAGGVECIIEAGDDATFTSVFDSGTYKVTVVGVGENYDAIIDVNDRHFDVDTDAGGVVDITKGGLSLHVKMVYAVKYPVETGYVKFDYSC